MAADHFIVFSGASYLSHSSSRFQFDGQTDPLPTNEVCCPQQKALVGLRKSSVRRIRQCPKLNSLRFLVITSAKVNILAVNASSAGAMGYIQFVVDNGTKAKKALEGNGISCYEEFVLHTTLPNVPGALAQFAKKLAAKDINIGACYQTTVKGAKKASVVLAVSHLQNAAIVSAS